MPIINNTVFIIFFLTCASLLKCYRSFHIFPDTYQGPATGMRIWKSGEAAPVDVNKQQKAFFLSRIQQELTYLRFSALVYWLPN